MNLGIVTVQKQEAFSWRRFFRPIRMKEEFQTQAAVAVAEVSVNERLSAYLPHGMLDLLRKRAVRFLKRSGCQRIALDASAEQFFRLPPSKESGICFPLQKEEAFRCFRALFSDDYSLLSLKVGTIPQFSQEELDLLCTGRGQLRFYTHDKDAAARLSDAICAEYGFYPEVFSAKCELPTHGIWLDLDGCRLGKDGICVADGAEYMLDVHGYRVSQGRYWSELSLPRESLHFVAWSTGNGAAS